MPTIKALLRRGIVVGDRVRLRLGFGLWPRSRARLWLWLWLVVDRGRSLDRLIWDSWSGQLADHGVELEQNVTGIGDLLRVFDRLVAVKKAWDPENVFHNNRNIPT